MHRYFIPSLNASGNKITITDKSQIHHLKNVLRLDAGEKVVLCDGQGNELKAEIEQISPAGIRLIIRDKIAVKPDRLNFTIACAIPKKSKFDDILDKLTQLGVERVIPLKTEHTVIKLTRDKEGARHGRWVKIAISASQQSQRSILPRVDPLTDVKELIKNSAEFDLKLIPTLKGEYKTLKDALNLILPIPLPLPVNILILIGPEGDFSLKEVSLALKHGFIPVSLGRRVLRVETAAIAVASFLMFLGESKF